MTGLTHFRPDPLNQLALLFSSVSVVHCNCSMDGKSLTTLALLSAWNRALLLLLLHYLFFPVGSFTMWHLFCFSSSFDLQISIKESSSLSLSSWTHSTSSFWYCLSQFISPFFFLLKFLNFDQRLLLFMGKMQLLRWLVILLNKLVEKHFMSSVLQKGTKTIMNLKQNTNQKQHTWTWNKNCWVVCIARESSLLNMKNGEIHVYNWMG